MYLFSDAISREEFEVYKYLRTDCDFIMLIRIIFISQIDFEEKPYKNVVYLKRGKSCWWMAGTNKKIKEWESIEKNSKKGNISLQKFNHCL